MAALWSFPHVYCFSLRRTKLKNTARMDHFTLSSHSSSKNKIWCIRICGNKYTQSISANQSVAGHTGTRQEPDCCSSLCPNTELWTPNGRWPPISIIRVVAMFAYKERETWRKFDIDPRSYSNYIIKVTFVNSQCKAFKWFLGFHVGNSSKLLVSCKIPPDTWEWDENIGVLHCAFL